MIFAAILLGCGGSRSSEGGNNPPMAETLEQNRSVRLEEVIRSAPRNSTSREDWSQWESKFAGKRVTGRGWVSSVSVHPQEGKLFFIAAILSDEDTVDNTAAQVALLVEDAHSFALGEEEGSFLIDGTKRVQLGDNHAFQGRVSEYLRLDAGLLVSSGQGNLVVIRVMKKDINKE
jgi:hypothetical protein